MAKDGNVIDDNLGNIEAINIEDEMKGAYLDYAMSVIVGRALPDARDGLKPVHRRILYAMYKEGLLSSKRYSKCAGVVGEVLKKYHPHGDNAVYDTLVRMAQPWNLRYPLIDGQGNFGSVDGDSAAAYRYTEARLMKLAEEMLQDIEKDTVDFIPNFDDSTTEPVVLPTRFPNLLVNGSDGIAVGMATKIPPHNLREVISGIKALIKNPDLKTTKLMQYIPGPDFPTAGFICGNKGIVDAYNTGRGVVKMRAKATIETYKNDREAIVITEIPFQVNKSKLIENIALLVKNGKIEGISDLRDESDRLGMRIVVELKRGSISGVILNQLFKYTALQSSYGIILLSIVNGQPKILPLKDLLQNFVDHRKEVVTRRTLFELRQAEARAHILEGLKIAVENIDAVIKLIRASATPAEAKAGLMQKFKLSEIQAQAILDMRLQKLTGLEREKIIEEYEEVLALIKKLKEILSSDELIFKIITDELDEISKKYGDERRTQIVADTSDFSVEDLIQDDEMVVTISHQGYVKRNPLDMYRAQKRGGSGKKGMTTKDEDFVQNIFVASTHTFLLVFTTKGKLYWLKVHEIPEIGRTARGKAIVNLVRLASDESITAILPVKEFEEGKYIVMCTQDGTIKKTDLMSFANPRAGGIIALKIDDGDALISVKLSDGESGVFIGTQEGKTIHFDENELRSMGRTAMGVKGIGLGKNDRVVGMEILDKKEKFILTVAESGFGKRTAKDEYRLQGRGGMGIITMKVTEKTGKVIGVGQVAESDDIMIITNGGKVIRMKVSDISVIGRNTQGVRLIKLSEGEKVVAVARLDQDVSEEQ